jgi:hypothetical protein
LALAVLRRWLRVALAVTALAAGSAACFSPHQPACAFSCADDGRCPAGYTCADDGLCHRDDGTGTCDLPSQTDARTDDDTDARHD